MTSFSTYGSGPDISQGNLAPVNSLHGEGFSTVPESRALGQYNGTFTKFSKLPAEIRLKIWNYALPGPRVMRIKIKYEDRKGQFKGRQKEPRNSRFIASHPPPVGLYVCRESRLEALKVYELAFATKTSPSRTYINFEIDTLCLDTLAKFLPLTEVAGMTNQGTPRMRAKSPLILQTEFSKVRTLVIDERCVHFNTKGFTRKTFPYLDTIYLLVYGESVAIAEAGEWDIEECIGPDASKRTAISIQRVNHWITRMRALAIQANPTNPRPRISFVHMIAGGKIDMKDRKSCAKITDIKDSN